MFFFFLKIPHLLAELFASIFHILEEVEAGTTRTKQYCIARFCHSTASLNAVLHIVSISHRNAHSIEEIVKLSVICSKINKASTLLRNGNMKVEKVAEAAGYQNVEHFNRLFKKKYGMTPVQYRSNSR